MKKICSMIMFAMMGFIITGCCDMWDDCCDPCPRPYVSDSCCVDDNTQCCPSPRIWDQ